MDPIQIVEKTRGKRSGTAIRAKGRQRVNDILKAARATLVEDGYTQFSLRNIANRAGIHLSNLQYYFPGRGELIHALMESVADDYRAEYRELFQGLPDDPALRFEAVIDFHLSDIKDADTRHFFIQFWALLEASDRHTGVLLEQVYAYHINELSGMIARINARLSEGRIRQRATMIAALLEGMMLMIRDADTKLVPGEELIEDVLKEQILRIALDPPQA